MSDYIDETPLTDEEIAAAIAAAKKAKAERAKAQNGKQSKKANKKQSKSVKKGNNSSESLFDQIDSTCEEEKPLSPKMESAKSFSNAFAKAKNKREQSLSKKQEEEELEEEIEQVDVMPADEAEVDDDEAVVFAADDEADEYEAQEFESDEEYDENAAEYDSEDDDDVRVYTNDEEEDAEPAEFNGIFESDEEETPNIGRRVSVDEYEEDNEDDDDDEEDEDDDGESAVSTKTKVIIGIIIAVLVLAVAAVGAYFALNGGDKDPSDVSSVAADPNAVKSIKFAENSITVKVGESVPLNVIIEPETATDKTLMLKSGDMSIATVDGTGKVTGVASGSTTVTATLKSNDSVSAVIIINVVDEKQNAINKYNSFINSILDGSTDIDSDANDTDSDENTDSDSDNSNSDTDSEEKTSTPKEVLEGSIIRDLDSDGELELALYYTSAQDSNVRIFYLGKEGEDDVASESQYDEYGNLIEETDTESDKEKDSDNDEEKVILECDIYSDKYSQCYSSLEGENTSWDTVSLEVKEAETGKIRVTILSEDYKAPTYVYESSDESIVTVDNQGNVKGVKPGTCDVIVTSPLNSDAKAVVRVRVKDDTDLLEDYLAQVPVVNQTNDAVIPTETLIGKKIVDIDGDGMSELLLKFSYGHNVETINLVKVENEQCIVYKTYNNLSDLYDYYDGNGSYSNEVLVHYTTNKICMQYTAVVAKEGSKTKTSEQRIYTVDSNGSLGELVNFSTTTDITTKTVTSEVVVDNGRSNVSTDSDDNDDTDQWFNNSDSDEYSDSDYNDDSDDNNYVDEDGDGYDDNTGVYFGSLSVGRHRAPQASAAAFLDKPIPQPVGEPDDSGDDDNNDSDNNDNDNDNNGDDDTSRVTSTVTSEVTEETTKYFVNGTPVEKSVYEETLSTYASRYTVWTDWDNV